MKHQAVYRSLLTFLLCLLGACRPVAQEIAPSPTPSSVPRPTAIPIPATPIRRAPSEPLPAAIYFISEHNGQIMRLETDGKLQTQITFEPTPIIDFDVALQTGTIAYLYGEGKQKTLIALDGSGRRQIFAGEIHRPRISPDGLTVIYRLENPEPGLMLGYEISPPGIWRSSISGGRPSLLQQDERDTRSAQPGWIYWPVGYNSPGDRLLLQVSSPVAPQKQLAIVNLSAQSTSYVPTCCDQATWSTKGDAIITYSNSMGKFSGIYRTDTLAGTVTPVMAPDKNSIMPVFGAHELDDGQIYVFEGANLAREDIPDDLKINLLHLHPDGWGGGIVIGPLPVPQEVLWTADGSGVMLVHVIDQNRHPLMWISVDSFEIAKLPIYGQMLRWVPEQSLASGDCQVFYPLQWQAGAEGVFRPELVDLQGRLHYLGFKVGAVDGFYGDATREALRQFQMSRNLSPTGDLDCETWQALLSNA